MSKLLFFFSVMLLSIQLLSQKTYLNFQEFSKNENSINFNTCISNTSQNIDLLLKNNIKIKYSTKNWIYFNANSSWVKDQIESGKLKNIYFEFSNPRSLSDSAVVRHKINLVHNGYNLDTAYTGKGVIIGIVDEGIDFNHPDFKFANGKTRVLKYWDHTINGANAPQPYNYGVVWDSITINNGTCISLENVTAHGTTVSGIAAGNGRANNKNKGVAPEADIVVVETNFNLQNWTLSIADACDYIFKIADSLGKPAVINLSLGAYMGSHDGKDPAAEFIDSLLTAKNGRIIVCAAGNSGSQGKYHVGGVVDQDTTFFWNINNSGYTFVGTNKILFDLWTDTSEADIHFAYGADLPGPNYGFRGRTIFHHFLDNSTTFPIIFDTLYSSNGHRLACIETYREYVGTNFHLQTVFRTIDSLNYLYRFETFGNGKIDVWGGAWQQMSDFKTTIPNTSLMPSITHYMMPDTLQTIVSSWNCSDKVISVGNIRNRLSHLDKNNNLYSPNLNYSVGQLSSSSSKGPSRIGVTKPDVVASGDITLAAGPMWYLSNSANNSTIDQGGFHIRNGGTSMSSPVVAGIAALYLQKCSNASYQDFKTDLLNTSLTDSQTGMTPNNAYGYGKVNAHETLLQKHYPISIIGPSGICIGQTVTLSYSTQMNPSMINWSNGFHTSTISTNIPGNYSVYLENEKGCRTKASKNLQSYTLPYVDAGDNQIICSGTYITLVGSGQATSYIWNNNVQNNVAFIPSHSGYYKVTGYDSNGCSSIDSTFIDFYNVQPVSYNETVSNIGVEDIAFNVTQGNPSGGNYSGDGIIGTTFHPGLAGIGDHYIVYSLIDNNGCISSDSSLINVYNNLGINQLNYGFSLYPNPTNDLLNIISDNPIELVCYSIDGKKIEELKVDYSYQLNTFSYPNGIYYIISKNNMNNKPKYFIKN